MMTGKDWNKLPRNIEAEQAVLGSMLINDDAAVKVVSLLSANDFYRQDHQVIFTAMTELVAKKINVDIVTLYDHLETAGNTEKAGGLALLTSLNDMVPTAANVEYYADIVREKSQARQLVVLASEIENSIFNGDESEDVIARYAKRLCEVSAHSKRSMPDMNQEYMAFVEELEKRELGQTEYLKTGFADIDRILEMRPGSLVYLAGRPSMGKSAFMQNIVLNLLRKKKHVALFSLEVSSFDVLGNLAMIATQKPLSLENAIEFGSEFYGHYHLHLFADGFCRINEICAISRKLAASREIDMLVIDHMQLISGTRGEYQSRNAEISEISRTLKMLAVELKIPVLCLSQLNRSLEMRSSRKPVLSDLRDSGSLEQDADAVMFIHRDEYFDPATEKVNVADIMIAKNRRGPVGEVSLVFIKEWLRFYSPQNLLSSQSAEK